MHVFHDINAPENLELPHFYFFQGTIDLICRHRCQKLIYVDVRKILSPLKFVHIAKVDTYSIRRCSFSPSSREGYLRDFKILFFI